MTLKQLEQRVSDLERQVAELRNQRKSPQPLESPEATFGMLGDDPEFDEMVRLGREYRRQANAEDIGC